MRNSVLDSYAILAFLCQGKGYALVPNLFERAAQTKRIVDIAAPNWAEVRYRIAQKLGKDGWRQAHDTLVGFPLQIVPADRVLAELAGELKLSRKSRCPTASPPRWRSSERPSCTRAIRSIRRSKR